MDPQNLKTASSYINNLLLSRGLLRNGKPIDFASPSKAGDGKANTLSRIVNLVHDLILRRDVRIILYQASESGKTQLTAPARLRTRRIPLLHPQHAVRRHQPADHRAQPRAIQEYRARAPNRRRRGRRTGVESHRPYR